MVHCCRACQLRLCGYFRAAERHESRRIDNQLRGRSGRQGDPGSTRFFLSLEDSLFRWVREGRLDGQGCVGTIIDEGPRMGTQCQNHLLTNAMIRGIQQAGTACE